MMKIGKYKLLKDTSFWISNGIIKVFKGSNVSVEKIDKEHGKVLIKFSNRDIEWFHESYLKNMEFIGDL